MHLGSIPYVRGVTEIPSSLDLGGISVVWCSWTTVAQVKSGDAGAIRPYLVLIRPASFVPEFRSNIITGDIGQLPRGGHEGFEGL